MKYIIILSLLTTSCTLQFSNNTNSNTNKRYYPFGTGLECERLVGTSVYDCTDISGNKIKAVHNTVNIMEN